MLKVQNSNSVLSSIFWKASERILVQGFSLIVQIILARLLFPEDFASLAIINAIVNYLGIFVNCGLAIVVMQKKNLDSKDLSTILTSSISIAGLLYLLLFFLAPSISRFYGADNLVWPLRVMCLSLFLSTFNSVQTGLLQRKMMFRTLFNRTIIAMPISAIVGILMAYEGYGVWALVAYSLTNSAVTVLLINLIPEIRLKFGFSWQRMKEVYSFSGKIILTNLISAGGDTIRTMTIGKIYKPEQLAYYDRGYSYSSLVTQVVNMSISSVLLPVLSRNQDEVNKLKTMARRSVSLSGFVMIPILIMVALMAEPLVILILSQKWQPCAIFFSVFCLLRIPGIITSVDKQAYYALGKSGIALFYEIALLAINISMLVFVIPYGVLAVAIGYTIIEYVGNFVLTIISSRVYHYSLKERMQDLIKPFINAMVMAGGVYGISFLVDNSICLIILQGLCGGIIYLAMAYITKDENLRYVLTKAKTIIHNKEIE